jgi:DNA-binding IclR family transcriptional regulator
MAVARGELLPEHSAVAVPVFGSRGEAVAALEVRFRECSVS